MWNNGVSSNVLTVVRSRNPRYFSAPPCINSPICSGVGTRYCGAPLVNTARLFFAAWSGKPSLYSAYSGALSLYIGVSLALSVSAETHECICEVQPHTGQPQRGHTTIEYVQTQYRGKTWHASSTATTLAALSLLDAIRSSTLNIGLSVISNILSDILKEHCDSSVNGECSLLTL